MSKKWLYTKPADRNPVNHDMLPDEPLDLEFPSNIKLTTKYPFFWIVAVFIAFKLLVQIFDLKLVHSIALGLVPCGYMWGAAFSGRFHVTNKKFAIRVGLTILLAEMAYALTWFVSESLTYFVLILASIYTVKVASRFRSNWVHFVTCGFTPDQVAKRFREKNRLPQGVKPKSAVEGFAAAIKLWLTYDPCDSKSPGVHKSPHGIAAQRIARFVSLVVIWTVFLTLPQCSQYLPNPVAFIVAVLGVAVFLPLSVMFCISHNVLGAGLALYEHQSEPHFWPEFIEQLRSSPNKQLASSIHLGNVDSGGAPILYPLKNLTQGGWIQGSPGSGKTYFCSQLIEQLVMQGVSVVTLDMKASSHELLHSAIAASRRVEVTQKRKVPVYPFTTVHSRASYLLDIFSQDCWITSSPEEKVGMMLGYFGLLSPARREDLFFRDTSWTTFQFVMSKYPNIRSFREAAEKFRHELQYAKEPLELTSLVKKHGEHPRMILHRLGMVDAMNRRETFDKKIVESGVNLKELFQSPAVLHCALPSTSDPIGNPEIGRVVLTSLLSAGARLKERPCQVVVIIDEFQRMISRSLDLVLQQCRSLGIGVILTNQSSADLAVVDPNMVDTIASNTAMQAWLKTTDEIGMSQLNKLGGDYVDNMISVAQTTKFGGESSQTTTYHEQILPRVSRGLIDHVNSTMGLYFLRLTQNAGYAAFGGNMFVAKTVRHATNEEFEKRKTSEWPEAIQGMLINGEHRPESESPSLVVESDDDFFPTPTRLQPRR